MAENKTIVIIGAGPGIGRSVTNLFASNGYTKIALLARRDNQLQTEKTAIEAAVNHPVTIKTYVVDVSDGDALVNVMDKIDTDLGQPETIFYNAARVVYSKFFEHPVKEIEYDFKVSTTSEVNLYLDAANSDWITVTSLYQLAGREIPRLVELAKSDPVSRPGFIVTSSLLPKEPEPDLFALSLTKGAQWNLVKSLHKEFGPQGVRIGVMIVGGFVSPEEPSRNPDNIASKTWEWFSQPIEKQPFEVEIL
jgi:short-subunit dehydrogenase